MTGKTQSKVIIKLLSLSNFLKTDFCASFGIPFFIDLRDFFAKILVRGEETKIN